MSHKRTKIETLNLGAQWGTIQPGAEVIVRNPDYANNKKVAPYIIVRLVRPMLIEFKEDDFIVEDTGKRLE